MTTKVAIIATLVVGLVAMVLGLAVLFLFAGGRNAELLGQAFGMLTLVPLGIIWIMWADRFRKERERRNKGR
jgi:hypothetical protein